MDFVQENKSDSSVDSSFIAVPVIEACDLWPPKIPTEDTKTKPKTTLTLAQKVDIIKLLDNGEFKREIQKRFKIGKSQLNKICRFKEDFLVQWELATGDERNRKRLGTARYKDLNEKLYSHYLELKAKNRIPTRSYLVEQALLFAKEFGYDQFSASNGWYDCWKSKYIKGKSDYLDEDSKSNVQGPTGRLRTSEFSKLGHECESSRQLVKDFRVHGLQQNSNGSHYKTIELDDSAPAAKRQRLVSDVCFKKNDHFVAQGKQLSLKEKVTLLRQNHIGESVGTLCKGFNVEKDCLKDILEDEINILRKWKSVSAQREINEKVWIFYTDMKNENKKVGRSLLKTKAEHIADELDHRSFHATDDWVDEWKNCYIKKCSSEINCPVLDEFSQTRLHELEKPLSKNKRIAAHDQIQAKCRLTLDEKMEVLICDENGLSSEKIAQDTGVRLTQIKYIVNHRKSIIKRWLSTGTSTGESKKCMFSCTLDAKLLEFYLQSKERGNHVNRIKLQSQAMKIAKENGLKDFYPSNSWLSRWRKRNVAKMASKITDKKVSYFYK